MNFTEQPTVRECFSHLLRYVIRGLPVVILASIVFGSVAQAMFG